MRYPGTVQPHQRRVVGRRGDDDRTLQAVGPERVGDEFLHLPAALTNQQFEEYRTQLEQRVSVIEQGLVRTGVRIVSLGTEEVIELFYKLFNPGELEKPLQVTQIAQ